MDSIASNIISKFGGVRPMARALDYPPSTVKNWETRRIIPAKQQPIILSLAQKIGVSLSPNDFFDLHKKPKNKTNGKNK